MKSLTRGTRQTPQGWAFTVAAYGYMTYTFGWIGAGVGVGWIIFCIAVQAIIEARQDRKGALRRGFNNAIGIKTTKEIA